MTGMVHSIITRRQFVFTNVASSTDLDVPLVRALDVTDAKAIEVVVRVHALSISGSASITIRSRAISLTSEEPDTDYTNTTELGTVTLNAGVIAPALVLASLTPPWGQMIRLFLRGTQPAGTVTISTTLSIDIVVRDQ